MLRIFAVALVCAASSVGCSSAMKTGGPLARSGGGMNSLQCAQQAPRPDIQRTACHQPVGVMDLPAGDGCGRGCGSMGCFGPGGQHMVDGCVSCIADCHNGCCGGGCADGSCGMGPGHGRVIGHPGHCICGNTGRCACCQKMKAMGLAAADMALDPRACMTDAAYNFNPGPPSAQTAYPYYTTRGPRDFLMANPPSIGPY
jgi:hypothetical protein